MRLNFSNSDKERIFEGTTRLEEDHQERGFMIYHLIFLPINLAFRPTSI